MVESIQSTDQTTFSGPHYGYIIDVVFLCFRLASQSFFTSLPHSIQFYYYWHLSTFFFPPPIIISRHLCVIKCMQSVLGKKRQHHLNHRRKVPKSYSFTQHTHAFNNPVDLKWTLTFVDWYRYRVGFFLGSFLFLQNCIAIWKKSVFFPCKKTEGNRNSRKKFCYNIYEWHSNQFECFLFLLTFCFFFHHYHQKKQPKNKCQGIWNKWCFLSINKLNQIDRGKYMDSWTPVDVNMNLWKTPVVVEYPYYFLWLCVQLEPNSLFIIL